MQGLSEDTWTPPCTYIRHLGSSKPDINNVGFCWLRCPSVHHTRANTIWYNSVAVRGVGQYEDKTHNKTSWYILVELQATRQAAISRTSESIHKHVSSIAPASTPQTNKNHACKVCTRSVMSNAGGHCPRQMARQTKKARATKQQQQQQQQQQQLGDHYPRNDPNNHIA